MSATHCVRGKGCLVREGKEMNSKLVTELAANTRVVVVETAVLDNSKTRASEAASERDGSRRRRGYGVDRVDAAAVRRGASVRPPRSSGESIGHR